MAWLLAYDIGSPRRWRKVYRLARADGVRLQYSLFYLDRPALVIGELYKEIGSVIDRREDDVRFYELPGAAPVLMGGQMRWPRGITSPLAGSLLRAMAPMGDRFAVATWHRGGGRV
jgi:CRISPR-associated endonuclease Cas2